jgi:hypothetical protein
MANAKAAERARAVLAKNRADVLRISSEKGLKSTRAMLAESQRDLEKRIREAVGRGLGDDTFTHAQLRATLEQVKQVQRDLNKKLAHQILSDGMSAAEQAATNTAEYLHEADKAFRGIGVQPLALNEARMIDAAVQGTQSSILSRLASSGEPASRVGRLGELVEPVPAKEGILARYGLNTISVFEKTLQRGLIARKSFSEMRDEITVRSPFLQGAPRSWAERIVRTELAGAFNRGAFEAMREADDELGDVVKILIAIFDNRTAADSYAVHGQIRRPTEAFETWTGLVQHPPARPNDREAMVTHRIAWELPAEMHPKSPGEVAARWAAEHPPSKNGHKAKAMPPIPLRSTVPIEQFGKPSPRRPEQKAQERPAERSNDAAVETPSHEGGGDS